MRLGPNVFPEPLPEGHDPHVDPPPGHDDLPNPWIFGDESACFLIAAAAWPFERVENRESWAVRMVADAELRELTIALAHERLDRAAAHLRREKRL